MLHRSTQLEPEHTVRESQVIHKAKVASSLLAGDEAFGWERFVSKRYADPDARFIREVDGI